MITLLAVILGYVGLLTLICYRGYVMIFEIQERIEGVEEALDYGFSKIEECVTHLPRRRRL